MNERMTFFTRSQTATVSPGGGGGGGGGCCACTGGWV